MCASGEEQAVIGDLARKRSIGCTGADNEVVVGDRAISRCDNRGLGQAHHMVEDKISAAKVVQVSALNGFGMVRLHQGTKRRWRELEESLGVDYRYIEFVLQLTSNLSTGESTPDNNNATAFGLKMT